jgi:PTS system beta-glucosides-specific IIC component
MSAIGINNLAQYGVDYIFPMSFTANFAQTAVVLAVYLKTRSKEQKALAIPAMVSGIFCIIEPAIYGFSLPVKKRFIFSMIGGAVGSFILAISATKMYAFAFGILGFVSFINPENGSLSGLYIAIFASIVTMIVSFCLTYFTFKEEEDVVDSTKKTLVKTEAIYSPVEGEVLPITMASDQSFALEMMGKGVVIKPKNGKITSPINGIIKTIFPGGHAIGIESPSGVEVLIHIGVDTVELKGEGFEILANVDDEVVVGQELVNVNLALLSELNVKDEVMVVITNTPEFLDVIPEEAVMIKKGKKIITVIPFSQSKETQLEVAHS